MSPPTAFGTHLSTADLLGLWTSLPATALRFWLGLSTDLSEAVQRAEQRRAAGTS